MIEQKKKILLKEKLEERQKSESKQRLEKLGKYKPIVNNRPKKKPAKYSEEESRGSLSDFIASDDSENEEAYQAVKKAF